MKGKPVVGLDLIRFAAAVSVMAFHLIYWIGATPKATAALLSGSSVSFPQATPYTWWGWVGVEVFFVLSGFVIAYSADGKSAAQFLKGRIVRLYPAAWICGTITLLAVLAAGVYSTSDVVGRYMRSMVLLPLGPWIDGVYWTLGIEIMFYTAVFLLLAVGAFRRLPLFLAAIGTGTTCMWIAWALDLSPSDRVHHYATYLLLTHGCFFALGGYIWLSTKRRLGAGEYALCGVFIVGGLIEIWSESLIKFSNHGPLVPSVVWLLAVAAIVASVQWNERLYDPRFASIARHMGLATYPLYLIHDSVGAYFIGELREAGFADVPAAALAIVSVLLLAFAVSTLLERRVAALIKPVLDWAFKPTLWRRRRVSSSA